MMLTVTEFVARAEEFADDERTPFAELPWKADSEIIFNEGDHTDPIVRDGKVFAYFLEASVISNMRGWIKEVGTSAFVSRVISYAENDA